MTDNNIEMAAVRTFIEELDPAMDNLEMAIEAMGVFDIPEPLDPDCSVCPWLLTLAAEIHGETN